MLRIITLITAVAILVQPICAQKSDRSLGWDLTYKSVLERNNVARSNWIWDWLNSGYQEETRNQTPAQKWIAEWRGKPIVSSILIEYPAFHAGEHVTEWFVRTENHAYYWRIVEDPNPKKEKQDLNVKVYDDLFRQASSWEQAVPLKAEDLSSDAPPDAVGFLTGYIGFLSLYEKGKSSQMLLTFEDFITCSSKECCTPECKTLKSGRLLSALEPIYLK